MKKFIPLLLCFTMILGLFCPPVYAAPEWPSNISISAGGGIVMDADSGAVIFGNNIHEKFYPASITKILTALIVIENCDLDEIVTYSHNAVYNVEANSSNAALEEGDQLTVRDSLYAMVLKSANEAANALAEHTAGSIEAFADMMNDKARELGCQNSSFRNPSGLNNDEHYTSPYDMALIAQAAFNNETFVEIDSTLEYKLPATKRNKDGLPIYPGHRMMKKSQPVYYPGVIGGKTGYTIRAGNTLVTCAERNGMKLIAVVLDGYQTHYSDTKTLLDFGFNHFKTLRISDYETAYTDIENDLAFAGLPAANLSVLTFTKDSRITLPGNADFADAESAISYQILPSDPDGAVARIEYTYNERKIGSAYLIRTERSTSADTAAFAETNAFAASIANETADTSTADETEPPATEAPIPIDTTPFEIPPLVFTIFVIILTAGLLIAGIMMWRIQAGEKEEEARRQRDEKRRKRLKDIGVTVDDFEHLMSRKRTRNEADSQSIIGDEPDTWDDEY